MAASKNRKVKQAEQPKNNYINQGGDPDSFYKQNPSWNFGSCDTEMWSFSETNIGDIFWSEVFPYLKSIETQNWGEILIKAKKNNHYIEIQNLNKCAIKRLEEKFIECESIVSLRLTGQHRIYGHITGNVFHVLWFDKDHGNNTTCVCRSNLKNT